MQLQILIIIWKVKLIYCAFKSCLSGVTAELVVRKLFIFLKENLDFESEQDALIQRYLLNEKEKEDSICKDQCKAFWCERYLKLLIMKKRCSKFIEFFHDQETSSKRHIISEQILRTKANLTETNLRARGNGTAKNIFISVTYIKPVMSEYNYICLFFCLFQ